MNSQSMPRQRIPALATVQRAEAQRPPIGKPSVSVVITNFNYARFLPEAVTSALGQTDVDVEVIVVDDLSTDDSQRVIAELVESDPRVRSILRTANGGPVAAFNDGVAAVDGTYLVRLDADDVLTPGSLARSVALAERFPSVGFVYGNPVHFHGAVPQRARTRPTGFTVWSGHDWLALRCALAVNCITSPEVLMRTSVLREVGGMRALHHAHDFELWMRLARASDVGHVDGADQAWHREHDASLSATQVDVMRDLNERADAFEILFTDGQGSREQNARLLAVASAALADEALTRTTQAYSAGRGGTPETDAYLDFARGIHPAFDTLPRGRALASALRLGPIGARRSPYLVAKAVEHRVQLEQRKVRWARVGL